MSAKDLKFSNDARKQIEKIVDKLTNAIKGHQRRRLLERKFGSPPSSTTV
ncbi:MAG: hypothetical protein R2688_05495 [Fimbriimonadaceae bacterium]